MKLSDLAELCYRMRCKNGRRDELSRNDLREIEEWAVSRLREHGFNPGRTAEEADELKLKLMALPQTDLFSDEVRRCLDEVVRLDGAEATPHRIVGRWAEFVNRIMLPMMVRDDSILPVTTWIKKRPVDTTDFTDMARAFAEWTAEADEAFEKQRLEREAKT